MTAPAYGYAHRGRVLRAGSAEGHYVVHIPALAPGCASGPFQSTVRDLQPGDNVLLTQVGLTSGDLVITGRLPERPPDFTLPIAISDVSGLQAALDDRATDAELAAVNTALTASILTEHNTNVTQDGRLTAVEGVNTTQNTRLDGIDTLNTTQNTRLTAVEGVNTTQDASITSLNTSVTDLLAWEVYQAHDRDVYGDALSSFPRMFATNSRTLVNQAAYIFRTRVRKPASLTQIRMAVVTTAGIGGSTTGAVYKSLSATGANGPYSLMNSGTNALSATGRQNFTVASSSFVRGDWLLILLLLNNGYTTLPKMATAQNNVADASILNPTSAGVVFGTKVGVTSVPATISPNDGTWTAELNPWWLAVT